MRIAVLGAHGTGKTTVCKGIVDLFNFNYIPDVVADAYRLNFTINEETPPETQFWILSKQLELERNTPTPWIMEKSLWDNIIYGGFSIKDKVVLKVIEDIVKNNAKYDLVFYCPIEFPIPNDGIRSLNKTFQKAIDRELRKYLKINKIKFHELRGNQRQRLKQAELLIRKRQ